MSDLETRLPEMLSDAADRFTINPDLNGATNPNRTRFVADEYRSRSPRLFVFAGASAAIALLIGGLVVVSSRSSDEPPTPADAPTAVTAPSSAPVDEPLAESDPRPTSVCQGGSGTEAVATLERSNGNTLTLYTIRESDEAPINGISFRETLPDGTFNSTDESCNPPGVAMDDLGDFWFNWSGALGRNSEVFFPYGKAPTGATSVEIDFDRGETIRVGVQSDGYFIGEFERSGTGQDPSGSYDPQPGPVRAYDADGTLISERDL